MDENEPNGLDIESSDDDNHGNSEESARIKSALYYAIGKLCEEEVKKNNMTFSKEYLACLMELVFSQCRSFANDLEAFSRHAKRTIINMDDVKLLARKNNKLIALLEEHGKKIVDEQKGKVRGRKRKAEQVIIDD